MKKLKRKTVNADAERLIITSLIVSDKFINALHPYLNSDENIYLLQTNFSQHIAKWCISYYSKYKKAPKQHIQDIYETEIKKLNDETMAELISELLSNLSGNYEREEHFNEDYAIDQGLLYLRERRLQNLVDEIEQEKKKGNIERAESLVNEYKKIDNTICENIDVCDNYEIKNILNGEEDVDQLFKMPGDLGNFLGWFSRGDLIAVTAPAKRGKCLTGDCQILLSNGQLKTVKEIYKNKINNIVTYNEEERSFIKGKVIDWFDNGIKKIYEVKTRTGRKVSITKNHPLLTITGWKDLKDLKIGDSIAVPKHINIFGDENIENYKIKVLAYLIADGCFVGTQLRFTKSYKDIISDFNNCVDKFGDSISWKGIEGRITKKKNKHHPSKCNLYKFIDDYKLNNKKSDSKFIPDFVFSLNKEKIALFLNRLFSCDGSVYKEKYSINIQYSSASKKLIKQVNHLLLRFGVIGILKEKIVNKKSYYLLTIRDINNIIRYKTQIGFFGYKKDKLEKYIKEKNPRMDMGYINSVPKEVIKFIEKYLIYDKYEYCTRPRKRFYIRKLLKLNSKIINKIIDSDIFYDEITNIEYIGEQHTYDLTIEDHHNFIANDILVHNSFWLIELAITAFLKRLRVVFFSLEMTKKQMMKRIYQNLLGEVAYPCDGGQHEIDFPYFENIDGKYEIKYKKVIKNGLSESKMQKKAKAIKKYVKNGKLRLVCPSSMSVENIDAHLNELVWKEGFVPDVIIVDYADIIKPSSQYDYRHQLDHIWKSLRSMAKEKHCLVITATHSNKKTFDKDIGQGDIVEDIRKINHVSLMFGLNQSKEEKDKNIMRLVMLANRHDEFSLSRQIIILQQLQIGKPYLDAKNKKKLKK